MQNLNNNIAIPKYLEELVRPTLGCFSKLAAAWDGLSVETQIYIFMPLFIALIFYKRNWFSILILSEKRKSSSRETFCVIKVDATL